jgi:hypothetical protein
VEGENICNYGTAGAAYELILAELLSTLGLAEVPGTTSLPNTPFLGIVGEVLWLILGGLLLGSREAHAQRNLLTDIVYDFISVTLLGQGQTLRVL